MPLVRAAPGAQRRREEQPVRLRDEWGDWSADDGLGRGRDQLGETAIAVEDVPQGGQRERALLHLLDEHPVGLLGGLEGEQLLAVRAFDDEPVDLALANRAQGLVGFLELSLELLDLLWVHRPVRRARWCHRCSTRSSPSRTRAVFDMSPMTRRAGSGSSFTHVGAAMICSPAAPAGWSWRFTTPSWHRPAKCSSQIARRFRPPRGGARAVPGR